LKIVANSGLLAVEADILAACHLARPLFGILALYQLYLPLQLFE